MSSGEADAVRFLARSVPRPDPMLFPPMSMGRSGFHVAFRFEDWQKRTRGFVLRCGHCKNLIEEFYVPESDGMVRYRHIPEVTARCPEILPYRA